jgi:Asp-tRNA(Asn)/Glu-tRNA(Gln) amidotransferase C subunit
LRSSGRTRLSPARPCVHFLAETSPALRSDAWQPYPDAAEILAQAPETEDGYIIVPDIPHTKLD